MKCGFTLVELSIVLVIVGLLIGGILVAQSMIVTANIHGVVKQLSEYDVAVANFQTRYIQLPGDSNLFDNPGNNNTKIGGIIGGEYGEIGNFWAHMSQGLELKNYQKNDYPAFMSTSDTLDETMAPRFNIRQSKVGQPFLGVLNHTYGFGATETHNYYIYAEGIPSSGILNNGMGHYDPLLPVDSAALDKKLDDGMPETGKFTASTATAGSPTDCLVGTTPSKMYNVANTDYTCHFRLEIGTFNGI